MRAHHKAKRNLKRVIVVGNKNDLSLSLAVYTNFLLAIGQICVSSLLAFGRQNIVNRQRKWKIQ